MSYPNYTPPVYDPRMFQRQQDEDHLRLLALFHYIVGGITAAFSCIFLLHFFMGIAMLTHPQAFASKNGSGDGMDQFGGWLFTIIGGGAVFGGWTIGGLTAYAGKCLKERKGSTLLMVISVLNCLNMPIGTALGVFTIVVLSRPTVKALFAGQPADIVYGNIGQPMAMANPTDPQQPWYRG